jgi:hypothetical protein
MTTNGKSQSFTLIGDFSNIRRLTIFRVTLKNIYLSTFVAVHVNKIAVL